MGRGVDVDRLAKGRQSRVNVESTAVAESTFLRKFWRKGILACLKESRVMGCGVHRLVMAIWLGDRGVDSSVG